jgi:hypothetical protein
MIARSNAIQKKCHVSKFPWPSLHPWEFINTDNTDPDILLILRIRHNQIVPDLDSSRIGKSLVLVICKDVSTCGDVFLPGIL